jgi:hypothetical protein
MTIRSTLAAATLAAGLMFAPTASFAGGCITDMFKHVHDHFAHRSAAPAPAKAAPAPKKVAAAKPMK